MELKDFILKKGISQAELARKLGVTDASISQIVHKTRNPSSHLINRIIDFTKGEVTFKELHISASPSRLGKKKIRKKKTENV
jgi:transcriptional regulator with XRE-family HTH domain